MNGFFRLVSCLLLSAAWLSPARALEAERLFAPIRIAPGAHTLKDLRATHQAWAERVLIAPMCQRSAGQPWQGAALHFVTRAAFILLPSNDIGTMPELLREADQVEAAGCRDPLFQWLALRLRLGEAPYDFREGPKFQAVYTAARDLPGPKALAWLTERDLCAAMRIDGLQNNPLVLEAVALGQAVLRDGSFTPAEDQLFYRLFFDGKGQKMMPRAFAFMPLAEEAPLGAWLQKMIRGRLELQLAKVDENIANFSGDEKRRTSFEKRFPLGRQLMHEAYELRPDRSDAAACLIPVEGREGLEKARLWFDRAVAAEFDAEAAYQQMKLYCQPGLTGSIGLLLSFGQACLETSRFDTIVPRFFSAAMRDAALNAPDWRQIYRRPDLAALQISFSRALADEPSRALCRQENLEFLAVHAFLAGDFQLAAATRRQLPGPLSALPKEKLASFGIRDFEEQLAALQSPAGPALARAETARGERDLEQVTAAMRAASASGGAVPRDRLAVASARALFLESFDTGKWVAPAMNDQSPDWQGETRHPNASYPRWHVIHAFPIGEEFEVRGTIPSASAQKGQLVGSLFIAQRARAEAPPYPSLNEIVRVELKAGDAGQLVAQVTNAFGAALAPAVSVPARSSNTVVLSRSGHGTYTAEVNGQPIGRDLQEPMIVTNGPRELIFGYDQAPRAIVKPTKMEVRKLKDDAPLRGTASLRQSRRLAGRVCVPLTSSDAGPC